jgi:peptide/nickel transport system permease protein
MGSYIIKRLLMIPPMMLAISFVVFLVISIGTSNIRDELQDQQAARLANRKSSNTRVEHLRAQFGQGYPDSPLVVQFGNWLKNVLTIVKKDANGNYHLSLINNFGTSLTDSRPVYQKIIAALPYTLVLNVIEIFLIYLLAIPLGVFSATHRNTYADSAIMFILLILYSLPGMWVAVLLIRYVGAESTGLGWLPYYGMTPPGKENMTTLEWMIKSIPYLVLPVTVMTYSGHAYLSRIGRVAMIDVINQDYIRTARAKGLPEWIVTYKHAFRNSLIPLITMFAGLLPGLIGGSVIIEIIFNIPGMGKLGYEAVLQKDLTTTMTLTTVMSFLTLIGILMSDIAYALVDPRISFEGKSE